MENPAQYVSFILSLGVGIPIGLLIGLRANRPRTIAGFISTMILMIISPTIGVSTCLFCAGNAVMGPGTVGVFVNYLLVGMLLAINFSYAIRLVREKKPSGQTG